MVDMVIGCDLRRARRQGDLLAVTVAQATSAIAAAAGRLSIRLIAHDAVITHAVACYAITPCADAFDSNPGSNSDTIRSQGEREQNGKADEKGEASEARAARSAALGSGFQPGS